MRPDIEQHLRVVAQNMNYPATPTIHVPLQTAQPPILRRYAWQLAGLVLVVLLSLLIWQPVQATVREWFGLSSLQVVPISEAPPADTEFIEAMTLSEKTTLTDAQARVNFTLRYPTEIGLPDEVYVQDDFPNIGVIMVWRDAKQNIRYALYQLANSQGFYKGVEDAIRVTEVGDSVMALWFTHPHIFWTERPFESKSHEAYLIEQPVLVWESHGILYRFESNLTLAEVIDIANSLTDIE